jgi:hypothetical protein
MKGLFKLMASSRNAATLAPLDSAPMQIFRPHGNGMNGSMTFYTAPATLSADLDRPEWRHREDGSPRVMPIAFFEGCAMGYRIPSRIARIQLKNTPFTKSVSRTCVARCLFIA